MAISYCALRNSKSIPGNHIAHFSLNFKKGMLQNVVKTATPPFLLIPKNMHLFPGMDFEYRYKSPLLSFSLDPYI